MERTMFNLRFVEERKARNGPYEVTQLINSFLGAMAHPWERWKKALKEMDQQQDGWPIIVTEEGYSYTPKSRGDLIRLMRNAMAHGDLVFESKGGEIVALSLWNTLNDWRARVKVEELHSFLTCFVKLAEDLYDNPPPPDDKSPYGG
jgi:HEPN pEK499 p136